MSTEASSREPDGFDLAPLARDLLGRSQDAEDVAQDVWLLLRQRPPERGPSLGWLRLAILHRGRRWRQRELRRAERERIVARPDRSPSVLERLEIRAQEEQLRALVDGLGEPYRQVVLLRYLEQLEVEEIAARLGHSPATVRSQLVRGLDQLRVRLGVAPRKRGKLASLLVWRWWSAAQRADSQDGERVGVRPAAIVAGSGAAALLLVASLVDSRDGRREVVSAARSHDKTARPASRPAPSSSARLSLEPTAAERSDTAPSPERSPYAVDVAGRVVQTDGRTVPGAAVFVGSADDLQGTLVAHADALGCYRVVGVDRRHLIWAEDAARIPSVRHYIGSKPADRSLDLRLGQATRALNGRVLTWDRLPVRDAEVCSMSSMNRFMPTDQGTLARASPHCTSTNATGSFRLSLAPSSSLRLTVRAEDQPQLVTGYWQIPESDQELELVLPQPSTLAGQLVRGDGTPVADAALELVLLDEPHARASATDERGAFRFEGVTSGLFALRVFEDPSGGAGSCYAEGNLALGEEAWVSLTLGDEHTIRGRALDRDLPLAGWTVELAEQRPGTFSARRTATANDGTFAFPSCAPGVRHALRLFEPSAEGDIPRAVVYDIRPSRIPIDLYPSASPPGSLTGRLEGPPTGQVPVALVLRGDALSEPLPLFLDPVTGAFLALRLPPGRYQLRAWLPGVSVWDAGRIEIRPEQETHCTLRVPAPGSLRLLVEDVDAVAWDELSATVEMPAFQDAHQYGYQGLERSPGEHSFQIDLLPGSYEVSLRYRGTIYERRRVRVDPAATTETVISFRESVLMAFRLSGERAFQRGESAQCFIVAPDGEIERQLSVEPGSRSTTCLVLVPRVVQEVRFRTSLGLAGSRVLTETDIAAGDPLDVRLRETSGQAVYSTWAKEATGPVR